MKTSEANIEDLKGMVVSDGTMRPEDIIPKFLNVLKVYGRDVYDKYVGENPEVLDLSGMDDETMGWVVDELFDKLNEIAPEGYSFGSQDGDGVCYGFWSVDADERKKCEDVPEIKVGDFVEYDKNGKEDWNWAEVTGVNDDGTLNLHITDMDKTDYDDVDNVPVASCHKLPRFAGMTDTGHYYMDGPINLYKGGWEICVTKKDLDPSKYEFIGTIDSYEDMVQVDAYYDDNYVYDEDDESEVREYFGIELPEGAVTFADFKEDVVGESCVKGMVSEGWSGGFFSREDVLNAMDGGILNKDWKLEKRFGNWGCYVNQKTGRPLVMQVMVSQDRTGDWGYKPVTSDMGPVDTNIQAAKWLKPRLEQWASEDTRNAESIPEYEWHWIDKCLGKETANKDRKNLVKSLVKGDKIKLIDTVANGAVVTFIDMITPSKMRIDYNGREMSCKTSFIDHKVEGAAESKKCEAYIQPVTLYSTTRYDDAEAVQSFLRDIGGDAVTVDMQRNGDVLSVNVSGSDDDVEAFVDTYKNEYGSIVKDCEVDATGWIAPEDIYYIATEQGRKELRGESKKQESEEDKPVWGVTVEYTPVNGETRRTDVAPSCFTEERAEEAAIARVTKDYGPLKDVKIIRVDRLPEWAARNIRDLVKNNKAESMSNRIENTTITEQDFSDILNAYVKEIEGTDIKPIRIEVLKTEPVEGDGTLIKFHYDARENGWSNARTYALVFGDLHKNRDNDLIYVLHDWQSGEKVTPEDTADHDWELVNNHIRPSEILDATKSSESLDSSIDVKGRGVVELSEDDYLKLSRDINSRGYCKDKDGGYNVWIGGSFKGKFPSVEAAADAGYTLVEGKRCEARVFEKTFKQGVDEFIGAAPEGGWSDYWAMQQDWEFYKDSLCRDGVITQKQADSWSNPCTPDTFDRWQKRNGLVHRGYESKKSEARPTKQEEQIKELCKLCRNDKNVAESVFKALTKDYNTSLDPVLAGQYLMATWKSKLEELGGCNGWYDGFKKLYAAMGSDFVCSVLQDLKLGSSRIGCGACITIVNTIYDKVVKRNEAKKSEGYADSYAFRHARHFADATAPVSISVKQATQGDFPNAPNDIDHLVIGFMNHDKTRFIVDWDGDKQAGKITRQVMVDDKDSTYGYKWVTPLTNATATFTNLGEFKTFVQEYWDNTSSESKKSESLTLKQKELKDMVRYGEAEDITTISDVEAKELKKKGIETVGISRGAYGMNGALLRDSEGKKYVITARSSNLFYFV